MDKRRITIRMQADPNHLLTWLEQNGYGEAVTAYYEAECKPTDVEQASAIARAIDTLVGAGMGDSDVVSKARVELDKKREDIALREQEQGIIIKR